MPSVRLGGTDQKMDRKMDIFDKFLVRYATELQTELRGLQSQRAKITNDIISSDTILNRDKLYFQQKISNIDHKINTIQNGNKFKNMKILCKNFKETIQEDYTEEQIQNRYNEFLVQIGNKSPVFEIIHDNVCPLCDVIMKTIVTKSEMVCEICGNSVRHMDILSGSLNFSESDVSFSNFSYKRINHFSEWLQNIQGKSKLVISDEVLKKIMQTLHEDMNVCKKEDITHMKVRQALKKLKLSKLYDHITKICEDLTGIESLKLTEEAEQKVRLMFVAIQQPFEKHKPATRKNFLSYSYCLYKFFELLGCTEFLQNFSLIKGADKLKKQDAIFKKICADLGWEFIESKI